MFWFYMGGRWQQPMFGTNHAAATVWTLFVFLIGALLALLLNMAFGQQSVQTAAVLGAGGAVGALLLRWRLPKALNLYKVDVVLKRQANGRCKGDGVDS